MSFEIPPYPRTLHLGDSGGGRPGASPWSALAGRTLAVEEKIDGQHVGLGFSSEGELVVFSRKSPVGDDPAFRPLLAQLRPHLDALFDALGGRYVLYGEWARLVHTVRYDALPSWFLEDDIFDRERQGFLDTPSRDALRGALPSPLRAAVPVLARRVFADPAALRELLGPSRFRSPALPGQASEGLYVKVEEEGLVRGRYKWVRADFLAAIAASGQHWRQGIPTENGLRRPE